MQRAVILTLITLLISWASINFMQEKHNEGPFEHFKQDFQKRYERQGEEQYRKIIFLKNKEKIDGHNADPEQTYTQGVNQFTDMTEAELQAIYGDLRLPATTISIESTQEVGKLGVNIDWVQAGKVAPVIDQGQCGASWAFSASGAFESAHMIKNNNFLASAQELLDCTNDYGNFGCNGGLMASSFKYIKQHRLHEANDYPYVGKSQKCNTAAKGVTWTLSGYTEIQECGKLLTALTFGPVSVAVDFSGLYNYKSGIVTKCGTTPSSASLLIGVTDDYWRLKQSFSVNWGENGYFRLARGNTCAVCNIASYPTI